MLILVVTSITALIASVAARILIDTFLVERISIAGELFGLEHVENSGVAFGIDFPPLVRLILIGIAIVFVIVLAYQSRKKVMNSVSFGLIIGGALANIVDRLDDGFVTDFIQVGWWPVFNVADSCITVGVVLLLVFEAFKKHVKSR
jgi:signal peptidase II